MSVHNDTNVVDEQVERKHALVVRSHLLRFTIAELRVRRTCEYAVQRMCCTQKRLVNEMS